MIVMPKPTGFGCPDVKQTRKPSGAFCMRRLFSVIFGGGPEVGVCGPFLNFLSGLKRPKQALESSIVSTNKNEQTVSTGAIK